MTDLTASEFNSTVGKPNLFLSHTIYEAKKALSTMQEINDTPVITETEPQRPPAHRPKQEHRKIGQKKSSLSPRQIRRALKRLEARYERKKKPTLLRCAVCYHLCLGPSNDRCQCKVRAQEYRYNPD